MTTTSLSDALRTARGLTADAAHEDTHHDDPSAVHAAERIAWAMARELTPAISLSRVPIAPMWLEPWAACQPLAAGGLARLVRTATLVKTKTGLVCIDPCMPDAWLRTPLGERMRSLHDRETSETFPLTLAEAIGAKEQLTRTGEPSRFTEVIFTSLASQSLRELLGTTHGDGVEAQLATFFPGARIVIGPGALTRARTDAERTTDVRGGLSRLVADQLVAVHEPTLLPSGLVVIPTGGVVPEHLTVAFVQQFEEKKLGETKLAKPLERARVAVVTSQCTSREQLSPYESSLPGLREHARLRDADVAPRGDAHNVAVHLRALRFERALADRDPADPRFHLVHPSQALTR